MMKKMFLEQKRMFLKMTSRQSKHTKRLNITFSMFISAVKRIEKKVLQSKRKYEGIYAIPRGGYILGLCLSHRLKLPMVSYLKKNVLVVDDICDTGVTLNQERYKNLDKAVIVTKNAGLDVCPDIIYRFGIADHIWVRFWWEVEDV